LEEPNKKHQAVAGFAALAVAAYFYFGTSAKPTTQETSAPTPTAQTSEPTDPPAPTAPPTEVTAVELARAYDANTVAADQKFKGKVLRITGIVQDISTDMTGDAYLELKGINQFLSVRAELKKGQDEKAAKLMKGDKVVLDCIGAGDALKSPMNNECNVVQMLRRK
jgi:hypothetical protein